MTSEPEQEAQDRPVRFAPHEQPEDPFQTLVRLASQARGDLAVDLAHIRSQLAETVERDQQRDAAMGSAVSQFMKEFQALEMAHGRGLAKALKALREQAEAVETRHGDLTELLSGLSASVDSEGKQTRQQITDSTAHTRTLMALSRDTKSSVVNLEHVITTAVALARDQTHERIATLHAEHTQASEAATERDQGVAETLGKIDAAAEHQGAVLGKASYDVDQLTRALPAHSQQVIDTVTRASEEDRRAALDMEGRVSRAIAGASERTEGALRTAGSAIQEMSSALGDAAGEREQAKNLLTSIAGDLGHLAGEVEAQAEITATAADVAKVRDEVSALGELLAGTTESFEKSVSGSIDTLTALRTAWSEETRRVLMALEEMARVFLEKANASEHARDEAVIELGRRVARLELDRPQHALTAGS